MIVSWLDRHAVKNWRKAHRMRSVQLTTFWTVVSSLYMALPAFQENVSPFTFVGLCVGFGLLLMAARLTHQPGVSD